MKVRQPIARLAGVAACIAFLLIAGCKANRPPTGFTKPAKITLDNNGVLVVDGEKVFPITLTIIPGPDAKAPSGQHAYKEFADAGVMFMRTGGPKWNDGTIRAEKATQAAAARGGVRCCPWLGWDLANITPGDTKNEDRLKKVIETFKDSPGMGLWKGADEPDWGNSHNPKDATPEMVANVAKIIHENDADHPIWLVQAPRGTVESLKRYHDGWDVGGIDIYPISYPPGVHSEQPNKHISMVGDFTRMMREVAGEKPFWMTLQIAFSGVVKPGRTLRFPTFPEQRFMAYEAVINGARGLVYFGGGLPQTFNDRDKKYGWNWTYWRKVMVPLLEEFGPKSPIRKALMASDSKISLTVAADKPPKVARATKAEEIGGAATKPATPPAKKPAAKPANKPATKPATKPTTGKFETLYDENYTDVSAMEFLVREVGRDVYVFACKKEGPTQYVRFTGLPTGCKDGTILFEEPRKVEAKDGSFGDWFGPFDVHIYKFRR